MSGIVEGEDAGKTMGSIPHEESTGSRPQDSGHNGHNVHKLHPRRQQIWKWKI